MMSRHTARLSHGDRARRNLPTYQSQRRAFAGHYKWQGPPHDLAGDNLALAGLFLRESAVYALGFFVLWLPMAPAYMPST